MSADTQLYLNPKFTIREMIAIIERQQTCKVEVTAPVDISPGYFNLHLSNGRMIHCHMDADLPNGPAILLSLHADDEGRAILKGIAECIGGLFMDNDYDGTLEKINGNLWEENDLAYHLRYAVIYDGIDSDDLEGLRVSIAKWNTRVS